MARSVSTMLEVRNLNRSFSGHQVLHDLSMTVADGRMTGFVGGNGAWKTTTMRIIMGVLEADSGEVLIDSHTTSTAQRAQFGYMPEERGLYAKMPLREQLIYLARLHGVSAHDASTSTDELLDELGLSERAAEPVENLSLGNQQRAQVAAAIVHHPTALILDEPFSGLDPFAVDVVLGVLQRISDTGIPVLFSSHQLDVVERLCEDLVIISDGHIVAAGEREELREQYSDRSFEIEVSGDCGWIRDMPGIEVSALEGGFARFSAPDEQAEQRVVEQALHRRDVAGQLLHFGPIVPSLAQIFKEVID